MRVRKHRLQSLSLPLYLLAFLALSLPAAAQTTAPNEWTWVGGSNTTIAESPVTGTLGTPAAGNIPPVRYLAAAWTGKGGDFWIFGGDSSDENGDSSAMLNDLWEFNPSTNEWAWMAGSTASDQPGSYGTMGTPSALNTPGSREDASSWTDNKGNLWLFGGRSTNANGANDDVLLNDLWEFSPSTSEWTWMSGSSTVSSCFNDGSGT